MRDAYEVLGVPRSASEAEIKDAYRALAKALHPDVQSSGPRQAERFKEVSAAYGILRDRKMRARHDRGEIDATGTKRTRRAPRRRRAYAGAQATTAKGPFDDLGPSAEDVISRHFGTRWRGARRDGADVTQTLNVAFLDAVCGIKKRIRLAGDRVVVVAIPAGVEEGQTIRLKGQGEAGAGGGRAGDALVKVTIAPHSDFRREGSDIQVELAVTLPEAVLGAKIAIPTIDGMVTLSVPKGSDSGSMLRLKNKGIADPRSGERGDHYVKLKVMLPAKADRSLERMVASWAERHPYSVREPTGAA